MTQNKIKIAHTKYPVIDLIKNRFSPYSFIDREISDEELNTIIEAGSWAFSSSNLQPWRLIVAKRGTPKFLQIWECLSEGNKIWAQNASALIVSIAISIIDNQPEKINAWAEHDLGAFNAMMILQAVTMGIIAHPMGGFSDKKIVETFKLSNELKPITVIAIGYLDEPDKTLEPFKTRDLTPRTRKEINEIIIN